MEANYIGPGWYWVENVDKPLFVTRGSDGNLWATHNGVGFNLGHLAVNITHIPRPAQRPIVDWPAMPAWANWVCMTENGLWLWYSEKPEQSVGGWFMPSGSGGNIPREYWPNYTGDWRKSLVERPE